MNRKAAIAIAVVIVAALGYGAFRYVGQSPSTPSSTMTSSPSASATHPMPQAMELPPTPDILPQRILGSNDAPVTMLEFASLTCGHCANFDQHNLPKIKKAYIDTGKVRLVYRDFPLGQLALVAAMVPHCVGADQYFGFLDVLFRTQESWAGSSDPISALTQVVRLGGMSQEALHTCLGNQALFNAIRDRAAADGKKFGIDSTPTFVINGTKVVGNESYETFAKIIDDALAAAN